MKKKSIDIVEAIHQVVPIYGWNEESLELIAEMNHHTVLLNDVSGAVNIFSKTADDAMTRVPTVLPWENMGIGLKVQKLIEARFKFLNQYKEVEIKTCHWLCLPQHTPFAFQISFQTADTIWKLAENNPSPDKSFSYYSKRLTTLAILSATTLFWLQDDSDNCQNTFSFLHRRLKNHTSFAKWSHKAKQRLFSSS